MCRGCGSIGSSVAVIQMKWVGLHFEWKNKERGIWVGNRDVQNWNRQFRGLKIRHREGGRDRMTRGEK